MNSELNIKSIKTILANVLGVEIDDVDADDSFTNDLHMSPTEITEFAEKLESVGVPNATDLDFSKIDSLDELFEEINLKEEL